MWLVFGLPTALEMSGGRQSSFRAANQDQARRLLSELPGEWFPGFRVVMGDIVVTMTVFYLI